MFCVFAAESAAELGLQTATSLLDPPVSIASERATDSVCRLIAQEQAVHNLPLFSVHPQACRSALLSVGTLKAIPAAVSSLLSGIAEKPFGAAFKTPSGRCTK